MKLTQINIYPIKSTGGIAVSKSKVENRGPEFDRRLMLVDKNNRFITQREFPKLAQIKLSFEKEQLAASFNGETIEIPLQAVDTKTVGVKIWSSRVKAAIYEDKFNAWFSEILGTECRLVSMPEKSVRRVSRFYAVSKDDTVSFADGYPYLLIGENSLEDLNSRLVNPVPMNRFRPNLVVAGAESFAEDGWSRIKIGDTIFRLVKPCGRCVMTTIDQESGEKEGVEPLKTLAQFRIPKRSVKRKILFGQNLIPENSGGIIRVGDRVEILETKRKPIF